MPRVHNAKAEKGEFCEPIFPNPQVRHWIGDAHLQHRMICCDCGLSHDFEFIIVEVIRKRTGATKMIRIAPKKYAIQFKVRRNDRSTSQIRRKKQVKK